MQKNILWTGIEYHSLENCIVNLTDSGSEINSSIIGSYNEVIYKLDYRIKTNEFWETTFFETRSQLNNTSLIIRFISDGKGNWFADGQPIEKFKGCIDIDISLTPFTNSLPINRLKLAEKKAEQIKVLYIDILGQETKPVHQLYTRLSPADYKYENVTNGFNSVLSVDELGLVVKYPGLFTRSFITESNFAIQ